MAQALLLTNAVRTYAWGSHTVLPQLLGSPVPSVEPWAEVWIGAHPFDASRLPDGRSLADVEPDLPFLVKLLAADVPLSIQAHPDRVLAAAGYADEEARGVPRTSPQRSYKDSNHKPELLVALTPAEALCGFRSPAEITALAARWGGVALGRLVGALPDPAEGASARALKATFATLVTIAGDELGALLNEVVTRASEVAADDSSPDQRTASWVLRLAELHPRDPGVVAPLLLRLVAVQPGEGLFVGAGVLHSYLHGAGVEIQASSDNVLRAGLTPKKIDIPDLLRVLVGSDGPAPLVQPRTLSAGLDAYDVPVDDFAVWRVRPTGSPIAVPAAGPRIVVCVEGEVQVAGATLPPGAAAYLASDLADQSVGGAGTCFVTAAGSGFSPG
jgi:mannose-6-phosphate isomerase